mmetsp:Transcript_3116/g.5515  ORF Transcript_3116/g.5515 Transcript_3116/m.5515 type:complete len:382 (-) Transcript_3116:248-1393(-)
MQSLGAEGLAIMERLHNADTNHANALWEHKISIERASQWIALAAGQDMLTGSSIQQYLDARFPGFIDRVVANRQLSSSAKTTLVLQDCVESNAAGFYPQTSLAQMHPQANEGVFGCIPTSESAVHDWSAYGYNATHADVEAQHNETELAALQWLMNSDPQSASPEVDQEKLLRNLMTSQGEPIETTISMPMGQEHVPEFTASEIEEADQTSKTTQPDQGGTSEPATGDVRLGPGSGITTLILKRLPRTCSRDKLVHTLQSQEYHIDYLYVPQDFSTHISKGYAVLNFCTEEDAAAFYEQYNRAPIQPPLLCARQTTTVTVEVALQQGLESNIKAHLKSMRNVRNPKNLPVIINGDALVPLTPESIPAQWKSLITGGPLTNP